MSFNNPLLDAASRPLPKRVAVIGAGAWGTALAIQADRAGQSVMLWARDSARAALMAQSRANERLLPGVPLPPGITVTANATQALQDAALILLVVGVKMLLAEWLKLALGKHFNLYLLTVILLTLAAGVAASVLAEHRRMSRLTSR